MDTGDSRAGRPDVGPRDGGDAAGGSGGGGGGSDGGARGGPRTVARLVGGLAGLAALAVLGLAFADPTPSRHLRGLLITVDLVCLAGVATAWLRVVLAVGAPGAPKRIE
ncbi:hypothetical protein FraQA3DRAFT_4904 [Frankia sp. QA3]|nr:hypothetical protein FraQA3DRAFT_4904 [Frankia sp. QA3]